MLGRVLCVLLVGSSLSATYETVASINQATGPHLWLFARLSFNIFFSLEAALRVASYIPLRRAFRDPFVWLDFCTIMPLYMRIVFYPASMQAGG